MTQTLHGPAAISLAVAGGRLTRAMSQSDMVEVLVAASELDSMVRSLGSSAETVEDRAALHRAHRLVANVLSDLQARMAGDQADRRRDARLRLAYAPTGAA